MQQPAEGVPVSMPKLLFADIGDSSEHQRNPAAVKTILDDVETASLPTEFPQSQTNVTQASNIVWFPMAAAHIPQHYSDASNTGSTHHNTTWLRSVLPVRFAPTGSVSPGSSTEDAETVLPAANGHQHSTDGSSSTAAIHGPRSNNGNRPPRCQLLCKLLARQIDHARQHGSSDLGGGSSTTARPHHPSTPPHTTFSSTDRIQLSAEAETQVAAGTPVLSSQAETHQPTSTEQAPAMVAVFGWPSSDTIQDQPAMPPSQP